MNYRISQLEIFPDELFLHLFSYIPPIDIYYAWHDLNCRISAIIRSIRISFDLIENSNENIRALDYFSKQIVFLRSSVSNETLDFRNFPNLCSLIIDTKLTKEQLDSIQSSYLPHLKRLSFSKWSKDEEILNEIIFNRHSSNEQNTPWLKVYHLPRLPSYFYTNISQLSHIQTMIFDRVTPYDINLILHLQPTLCRLKVTVIRWMSEDILLTLSLNNKNFQHQSLIHLHATMNTCNKLDDLYLLLSYLPFLRSLYIACDNLTITDFEQLACAIMTHMPRLNSFNCSFKQTRIEPIEKLHRMSPLFRHMKLRRVEWGGGWHYHCITTENL
ncbi:unnamed protein product [Rotaria magnacalcarata]|uniref:F-box domain-containing protein n=3 Tax=Rotaria magnacalcarata TaxID=392030 RepID=A0A819SUL1_9BILA|nr:unnamed protein product [Rotaria magnacalcarata]CAF2126914.1 unnamed protein product [Rotaria magnacalcarata]CAF3980575.1 unnamed protein product [Rotaria magnacalcarata]CAF4070686.1 unnamed protein product [Rotaria magnacalcarata]